MRFLIVTIFFGLISSGHLQEANSANDGNSQTVHGQEQRNIEKPCSRRSNTEGEPQKNHLTTPPTPKVANHLVTNEGTNLKPQPQSLRSGEINLNTAKNQILTPSSSSKNAGSYMHSHNDFLPIYNPIIDSSEDSHREIIIDKNEAVQNAKLNRNILSHSHNNIHTIPQGKFEFTQNSDFVSGPPNDYISAVENVVNSAPQNEYISSPSNVINNDINLRAKDEPSTSQTNNLKTAKPCSDEHEPKDSPIHSRRSMASSNDDLVDSVKDILRNDKDLREGNNDLNSHLDNLNVIPLESNASPNSNNLRSDKDQLSNLNKFKPGEKSLTRQAKPHFNEARREMPEPTKGVANLDRAGSGLVLMQSERICYACSTANNPTCWTPDRRTTVKYCRKGNNACITKTFGSGSAFTLIRDCGNTCDDSEMGGLMPRYKSCSMCHTELCNGAYTINSHSILLALFITGVIKYLS